MPTWTDPADFTVGEFPTAAKLTAILNNFDALKCGARVYHSANQSIADGTATALAFDSERYDTDTIHDPSTNNTRLTCKTAGKYAISANVSFAGDADGYREVAIKLNGTTFIADEIRAAVLASSLSIHVGCMYALAVNDYVECVVTHAAGGPLNVLASPNFSPEFSMHFLGG